MKTRLLIPGLLVLIAAAGWAGWHFGYDAGGIDARESERRRPVVTAPPHAAAPRPAATGAKAEEPTASDDVPLPSADSPAFAARVREVFADPFENRRLARLQLLLEKCTPAQFAAMVPLIHENDLRGTGSGEEWELVMQNWALKDGAGVMNFIKTYDWKGWHPLSGPGARYEALVGWATANPQAARAYFEDPANAMRSDSNLQRALIMGWVAKDPEGAAAWVLAPEQKGITGQAHQLIVDSICRKGGMELLDRWFTGLPQDSPNIGGLARAVATAKNRFQPDKAAEWIESQKGQPWIEEGNLVQNTAASLAAKDPAAALAWAGRTGSGSAVSTAMQSWCRTDVTAASAWLKANPNAPHYDRAATAVIQTIQREDPEAARAWAATLKDANMREAVLRNIGGQ